MANGWGGKRVGAGRPSETKAANDDTRNAKSAARAKTAKSEEGAPSRVIKVRREAVARAHAGGSARRKQRNRSQTPPAVIQNPFKPYAPADGVLPKDHKLAMDSSLPAGITWAGNAFIAGAITYAATTFLGYPVLAEMAQRPEYRKMSERLATEMTRRFIKLKSKSNDDKGKSDQIKELEDFMEELQFHRIFTELAVQDGFFGRSHLYLDTGDTDDPDELKNPIGDGRSELSKSKVKKGSLRALRTVEPVWCYPATYNASDPLAPDWFKPEVWFAMGKRVHHTRLLQFIGRPVSDLLKPTYAFGGLSLTQIAQPYVDNFLRNRDSVSDLLDNFSKNGIKTDLMAQLSPSAGTGATGYTLGSQAADDLMNRLDLYTETSDSRGIMALDKEEEFFQYNTPLGTTDMLLAQSMEMLCFVSGMPVVVLLGLTPHGLNASSEGEVRAFEDWVDAFRRFFYGNGIKRVLNFMQLSLWGGVDEDIVYEWEPLHALDEKEEEEVQKSKADRAVAYIQEGVLHPEEERRRLARDPGSGYNDIDVEDVPEIPPDEDEALNGLFDKRPAPALQREGTDET